MLGIRHKRLIAHMVGIKIPHIFSVIRTCLIGLRNITDVFIYIKNWKVIISIIAQTYF